MINTVLVACLSLTVIALVVYLDWLSERIASELRRKRGDG